MSEKTHILVYFTQWLCMHVFQTMHVTKNCVIDADHLTFFIMHFPREMNGNSLVFSCIDIRSKLRLNVTFYIVLEINLVSGFYNILVSFMFTSALIRSGSKRI